MGLSHLRLPFRHKTIYPSYFVHKQELRYTYHYPAVFQRATLVVSNDVTYLFYTASKSPRLLKSRMHSLLYFRSCKPHYTLQLILLTLCIYCLRLPAVYNNLSTQLGRWDSNPLSLRQRIYSPPRLSNFAAPH